MLMLYIGEIVDDAQAKFGLLRAEGTRHNILLSRGLGYNFSNSLLGGTKITPGYGSKEHVPFDKKSFNG